MTKEIFQSKNLTAIEREVLFLQASIESIGSMVNYELLGLSEGSAGAQAVFKSSLHQRLFNIFIVDFLSPSAQEITGKKGFSSLDGLVEICRTPCFDVNNSCSQLRTAVRIFKNWMERAIKVPVWFPSIQHNGKLRLKREEFIRICGDISKHSFSRLNKRARALKQIMQDNGRDISTEDALIVLDDFYEKFHNDLFTYHGSRLVEMLNNIGWGIHKYLKPELKRLEEDGSFKAPIYRFTYPKGVKTPFVKHFYQELIINVSVPRPIKRFKTYRVLKLRY
jgi:hypothetical protein